MILYTLHNIATKVQNRQEDEYNIAEITILSRLSDGIYQQNVKKGNSVLGSGKNQVKTIVLMHKVKGKKQSRILSFGIFYVLSP